MMAPLRIASQARMLLLPSRTSRSITNRRHFATAKQPSPTGQFYKTFTRPIAKVLLMAVLTYQLVYFGWTTLETQEIREQTAETIASLESKIATYKKESEHSKETK